MSRCGRGCYCRPGAAEFGGRLGHCVLHGVDVLLGYRVLHGVDVLLGRHVKQGFVERYRHSAPVVASVGGSDAYRAEAEPFTAKRSGTG